MSLDLLEKMFNQIPPAAQAVGVDIYVSGEVYNAVEDILIDGKFRGCRVINTSPKPIKKKKFFKSKFHN